MLESFELVCLMRFRIDCLQSVKAAVNHHFPLISELHVIFSKGIHPLHCLLGILRVVKALAVGPQDGFVEVFCNLEGVVWKERSFVSYRVIELRKGILDQILDPGMFLLIGSRLLVCLSILQYLDNAIHFRGL